MRKLVFFGVVEIAKCFGGKGLKIFIFLADSRIVSAQSVRIWLRRGWIYGFLQGCGHCRHFPPMVLGVFLAQKSKEKLKKV